MIELLYTPKRKSMGPIEPDKFLSEEEIQEFIKKYPKLLSSSTRIIQQHMPIDDGEIDVLALDKSTDKPKLMIIELKYPYADAKAFGQILRYADWIRSNSEMVKAKLALKGIEIGSSEIENPKLVIVAPSISYDLVRLALYVQSFEWDIIEISRFVSKIGDLIVVNHILPGIESSNEPRWELYRARWDYNEEEIELGKKLLSHIAKFCEKKGWTPELTQNREKDGYGEWVFSLREHGRSVKEAFGIGPSPIVDKWKKQRKWYIWFRLPIESKASSRKSYPEDHKTHWYRLKKFNYLYINLTRVPPNFKEYNKLFERAFNYAKKRVTE